MVLVIGIILGAFVAMILIVIFVLKKRIRVDGNGTVKGDEGLAGSSGPPGAAPGGPPGINHGPPGGAAPRYQVHSSLFYKQLVFQPALSCLSFSLFQP